MQHSKNNLILIADATESAARFWRDTTRVVADLIAALPESSVNGVHLLGTSFRWSAEEWHAELPLPPQAKDSGSFVAPIMSALRAAQRAAHAIVIVGAGEVYDLADWVNYGAAWALINAGGESLRGNVGGVLEVEADDLDQVADFLKKAPEDVLQRSMPSSSGFIKHSWTLDRTGYPMIFIPRLDTHIHLFPLTKPQFECFLADARLPNHGDSYYETLLKLNPRLSPMAESFQAYERLFITGLLPEDIRAYVRWHGRGVRLLTIEEWRIAYRWLESQEISVLPSEISDHLAPTARALWEGVRNELQPRTLLDLALLRNGVVEWASGTDKKLVGMGKPRTLFQPNLFDPFSAPIAPTTETFRSKVWGSRLIQART